LLEKFARKMGRKRSEKKPFYDGIREAVCLLVPLELPTRITTEEDHSKFLV